MTHDSGLAALLRSALPPVVTAGRSRDMWPFVVKRGREDRKWSWLDAVLAAAVAIALLIRPDLLTLLAYHF